MMGRNGYKPKRQKHDLKTAKQRMTVTKLTINNNSKPGIPREEQSNIRASVLQFELMKQGKSEGCWEKEILRVRGKVNHLGRFHPGEAARLKKRLAKLQESSE